MAISGTLRSKWTNTQSEEPSSPDAQIQMNLHAFKTSIYKQSPAHTIYNRNELRGC